MNKKTEEEKSRKSRKKRRTIKKFKNRIHYGNNLWGKFSMVNPLEKSQNFQEALVSTTTGVGLFGQKNLGKTP